MKRRKLIAFIAGFIMLFGLPADEKYLIYYLLIWLPTAIALIAYSGAFKSPKIENHE